MKMKISLSDEDYRLLLELLETEVRDLRSANYHAESHSVKSALKEKETVARLLLDRLRSLTPEPTVGSSAQPGRERA